MELMRDENYARNYNCLLLLQFRCWWPDIFVDTCEDIVEALGPGGREFLVLFAMWSWVGWAEGDDDIL